MCVKELRISLKQVICRRLLQFSAICVAKTSNKGTLNNSTRIRRNMHIHAASKLFQTRTRHLSQSFQKSALKPGYHVRRKHKQKHKHKKPTCNRCDANISALCWRLCLRLRRPSLHVRRNDASILSTSTRKFNDFYSLVLVLTSLRRKWKPGQCKHKHKRMERKLKNSDKFSAYILVRHVGIKRLPSRAIVLNCYASALVYVTLCICLLHV